MAQIIGYVATVFSLSSFQLKSRKGVVILQLFGTALFSIHFFMLEAFSGAILNAICMVRAAIFIWRDKKWAAHPCWIYIFSGLSIASFFISVFFLKENRTASTYLLELLPALGNVITTFAIRMKNSKLIRRYSILASPLWLCYNFFNASIGGCITEIFSIISIIIGMLRLDIKRNPKE